VNCLDDVKESVVDAAIRITDLRHSSAERVLGAIAEVDLTPEQRSALIERLQAAGVL
jgi:hypothetical protein